MPVFCCQFLGHRHILILTLSLMVYIGVSPLPVAVLPVGVGAQTQLFMYSLLTTLCPEKQVSRLLSKAVVELAPVSHILADSLWKIECLA